MKIILLGYMGSGKTAVGGSLTEKLRIPFMDLDEEIEKAEERTIPEIFRFSGEIHFRKKESEVLEKIISSPNDFVLSLGGGTPCYGNNLKLMKMNKEVKLVYLKTSLEELKARLFRERDSRPLISHLDTPELLEDFIRKHLFERTFYYNQSEIIISTDGKQVGEIAREIINNLGLD